jgi:hypothetical protein
MHVKVQQVPGSDFGSSTTETEPSPAYNPLEGFHAMRSGGRFLTSFNPLLNKKQNVSPLLVRPEHFGAGGLGDENTCEALASLDRVCQNLGLTGLEKLTPIRSVHQSNDQHLLALVDVGPSEAPTVAVALLRCFFINFSANPADWVTIIFWPTFLPASFVQDLESGQPFAAMLFIHWCAAIQNAPRTWFLDGWAKAAAKKCISNLSVEWFDSLDWPRRQLDL